MSQLIDCNPPCDEAREDAPDVRTSSGLLDHASIANVTVVAPESASLVGPYRGDPFVIKRGGAAHVEWARVERVALDFRIFDDFNPETTCGLCHSALRPADVPGPTTIWLGQDDEGGWTPCCEGAPRRGRPDAELLATHEPDRSVSSWCLAVDVRVDDARGLLSIVVWTNYERFVMRLRRGGDGRLRQTLRRLPRRGDRRWRPLSTKLFPDPETGPKEADA